MTWHGVPSPPERPVVGRYAEREAIGELLDAVREGFSGVLVLTGEPGIGKTRLLEYAAAQATGLRLVRLTAVESETRLGYGALHRLLRPFLGRAGCLPAPQRAALNAAFGLAAGPPSDRYLVGLASLTLLSEVAAEQPLLCLVDDAHWLDRESAETLAFTARRLHADAIGLIMAVRDGLGDPGVFGSLSARPVTGLPAAEARALLTADGTRRVHASVAGRIVAGTGGNPLALLELTGLLTAEQLSGIAPLPEPLPVSRMLEDHFRRSVQALPPGTRTLLLLIAAAPSDDAAMMWRGAGTLGLSARATEPAVAAGVLTRDMPPAFRHPLIRCTVYAGADPAERRRVHAALAAGGDPVRDADRRAWHRAEATVGPDEQVANALEAASEHARSRGGYSQQALFLSRAADFTGAPDRRAERRLGAARAHLTSGDPTSAQTLLDLAGADIRGPVPRTHELRLRAAARMFQIGVADVPATLMSAVAGLGTLDPRLTWELLWEAMYAALVARDRTRDTSLAEVARATAAAWPPDPGAPARGGDLLMAGLAHRVAGGYAAGAPVLRAAVTRLRDGAEPREGAVPRAVVISNACDELWDIQARREITDRLAVADREAGALFALSMTLLVTAQNEIWAGRFAEAEVCYAEFDDLAAATGFPGGDVTRIQLFALTGREADLRAAVRRSGEMADLGLGVQRRPAQHAQTLLALGLGRYSQAVEHARPVFEDDPPAFGNLILPLVVEAGVRGGDRRIAAAALARLEERAPLADTPWALGTLAMGRALLSDTDGAEKFYEESIDQLESVPMALEQARFRLLFGEWLRRRKRRSDARTQLRAAYESFDAFGAAPLAERARTELAATGETARKRSEATRYALTPRERQVALLAAAGHTNAEIASRLFVTTSTVEFHMNKVFRKLGITSRRQLAAVLGGTGLRRTA